MQTLSQTHQLLQKLTPQQVQYLKMLQLPIIALEQRIKEELETNPLLEEGEDMEQEAPEQVEASVEAPEAVAAEQANGEASADSIKGEEGYTIEDFMND